MESPKPAVFKVGEQITGRTPDGTIWQGVVTAVAGSAPSVAWFDPLSDAERIMLLLLDMMDKLARYCDDLVTKEEYKKLAQRLRLDPNNPPLAIELILS